MPGLINCMKSRGILGRQNATHIFFIGSFKEDFGNMNCIFEAHNFINKVKRWFDLITD